jgi:outer membrane protein TolC
MRGGLRKRRWGDVVRKRGWLLLPLLLASCDRAWYRRDADREAYGLISSHIVCPQFDVGRTRVEPDAASRLFDPDDPDHPRRPPDDPIARLFMNRPGGMRGGKRWDRDGIADSIENPAWEVLLGIDANGKLKLDQNRAMEIALLDSREYQTQIELLYSTALDLSLAQYHFAPQWFARQGTTYSHFGSGGFANGESNTLALAQDIGFTRALAAGGNLLVDLANSLIWEFSNGGAHLNTTILTMSLVQPLLRGAGREVNLEALTQAERNLLYQVRTFARFRKQFWADTTTTGNGYLSLLLDLQSIRNAQNNLKSQEQNYRLYQVLLEGGKVSTVQVDQVFRNFLSARLGVAQAEATLQTSLDFFKLRLGLPPRIPIELDDSQLSQFQLTDKGLDDLREETAQFQSARNRELNALPTLASLRESFATFRELLKRTPVQFARVKAQLDEGTRMLDRPAVPDQDPEQMQRTRRLYDQYRVILKEIEQGLATMPGKLNADEANLTEQKRKDAWDALQAHTRDLLGYIDDLVIIQTVVGINRIELPTLEADEQAAIAEAQENRLDLMNAKAAVTDAWRKVRVAANALRGDLNLTASANLANNPLSGNPLGFSAMQNRYTVGVNFDAPLNRLAERNIYRQSLINYQQARRAYMALSDGIEQQVRRDLRQLSIQRLSFEISRQSLISAARQVEAARADVIRATDPTSTLNLLNALDALLSARNTLAQSYIGYEQLRVQFLLDTERLQLDSRGFPTDEHAAAPTAVRDAGPAAEPLPAPRPAEGR